MQASIGKCRPGKVFWDGRIYYIEAIIIVSIVTKSVYFPPKKEGLTSCLLVALLTELKLILINVQSGDRRLTHYICMRAGKLTQQHGHVLSRSSSLSEDNKADRPDFD